ncbi:hypothetical protein F5878DRAFT_604586 [Lentinula raphanica]|uniref:Ams2/SPT21 N-terminal domain-containing protein n=1 Tax=Lentinula raphanica TaxID=153919 RepID=A0AA38PIL0_9AGAR|nr:hypothetical protein F5878DRAFT_604586 [Lentinula raphanica]
MESKQIRVLHSIAPAETYILSRSTSPMQVYPVNNASGNTIQFADVSLKSCMDIIHASSPDLFSSSKKDFSVYCMDPLESSALMASTSTSFQPVSVACGRLSAIRLSDGQAMVTGTLVRDRVGQEALQLVFVLREIVTQNQIPDPAATVRINAALARQTEENDRTQRSIQKRKERRAVKPAVKTEADRILEESGNACLIRPGDTLRLHATQPRPFAYRSASGQPDHSNTTPPPAQDIISPTLSSQISLASLANLSPELLVILDTVKHDPQVNSEALLRVISFIDSAMKSNASLTVTDALRKLAPPTTSTQMPPETPETPPWTPPPAAAVPATSNDGVVILDKENVKPSASRRRKDCDTNNEKTLAATTGLPTSSISQPPHASASRPLQSNSAFTNEPSLRANTTRKRTLSEVLEDTRPLGRNQGRLNTFSSPVRPARTTNLSPGHSQDQPIVIPDSPSLPKSNQKPNSRGRLQIPYVVPDWARTDTAMQPRLSEETQLMLKEAEQRKKEEKMAKRMKWSQQRQSGPLHRAISTPAVFSTGMDQPVASTSALPSPEKKGAMAAPPPPSTAPDSLLPVIAVADTSISFPSSSRRSPSPPSSSSVAIPCTPPRKRPPPSNSSPEEDFSLFTPRGMNTPRRGPSIFQSPTIAHSSSMRPDRDCNVTPPPSSGPLVEDDSENAKGTASDDEDFLAHTLRSPAEGLKSFSNSPNKVAQEVESHTDADIPPVDNDEDGSKSDPPIWPGLPPSSPPPQFSPMLHSVTDESPREPDDDFSLPMASSDFDIDELPLQTEPTTRSDISEKNSTNADLGAVSHEGLLDEKSLAAMFEILANNLRSDTSSAIDESHDIFKDLGAVFDEPQHLHPNQSGPSILPPNIAFDNSEFWNAISPLLNQTADNHSSAEVPDPVKDLFSGCVL